MSRLTKYQAWYNCHQAFLHCLVKDHEEYPEGTKPLRLTLSFMQFNNKSFKTGYFEGAIFKWCDFINCEFNEFNEFNEFEDAIFINCTFEGCNPPAKAYLVECNVIKGDVK